VRRHRRGRPRVPRWVKVDGVCREYCASKLAHFLSAHKVRAYGRKLSPHKFSVDRHSPSLQTGALDGVEQVRPVTCQRRDFVNEECACDGSRSRHCVIDKRLIRRRLAVQPPVPVLGGKDDGGSIVKPRERLRGRHASRLSQ